MRTARWRTSGANLFVVLLISAPLTQKLEPPANPGRVWMPPRLQGDFLTLLGAALHRSCVRPHMWLAGATGRYAVRTMRATSVQRPWFAQAPGLVSRVVNIEVLAA